MRWHCSFSRGRGGDARQGLGQQASAGFGGSEGAGLPTRVLLSSGAALTKQPSGRGGGGNWGGLARQAVLDEVLGTRPWDPTWAFPIG